MYKTFLRPYVAKHETDIDRKLLEMRARAWDLTVFYWQNCAQYGHTAFLQALQYLAANSTNFAAKTTTEVGHIYNAIHFSGFSSIDRSIVCIRILDRASNRSFTSQSQTVDDDQQDATAPAPQRPNVPLRKPSGKNKWPPESPPATPNGRAATVNRRHV